MPSKSDAFLSDYRRILGDLNRKSPFGLYSLPSLYFAVTGDIMNGTPTSKQQTPDLRRDFPFAVSVQGQDGLLKEISSYADEASAIEGARQHARRGEKRVTVSKRIAILDLADVVVTRI